MKHSTGGIASATDVMIDLETLGTKPGCVVLSIGACTFNRFSGDVISTFYAEINRHESAKIGLKTDANTVNWWLDQDNEAKALLERTGSECHNTPKGAIEMLIAWFSNNAPEQIHGVWANDPDFDCLIIRHVFDAVELDCPWEFWMHRSCRTAVDTGVIMSIFPKRDTVFTGIKHNALDDAKHQVKFVSAILRHTRNISQRRTLLQRLKAIFA